MNEQIDQLKTQIMNTPRLNDQAGADAFNQLRGWLSGYIAHHFNIDDQQQLTILSKVAELQKQ